MPTERSVLEQSVRCHRGIERKFLAVVGSAGKYGSRTALDRSGPFPCYASMVQLARISSQRWVTNYLTHTNLGSNMGTWKRLTSLKRVACWKRSNTFRTRWFAL